MGKERLTLPALYSLREHVRSPGLCRVGSEAGDRLPKQREGTGGVDIAFHCLLLIYERPSRGDARILAFRAHGRDWLAADAGRRASQMESLTVVAARGCYKERSNTNDSLLM